MESGGGSGGGSGRGVGAWSKRRLTCSTGEVGVDDFIRIGIEVDEHPQNELPSCYGVALRSCTGRGRLRGSRRFFGYFLAKQRPQRLAT